MHIDVRSKNNNEYPKLLIRSIIHMNKSTLTLPLSIVVLSVSGLLATGQQPRPMAVPTPGAGRDLTPKQSEPLSTNYRITFSGKSDEKNLGELSSLTCSTNIYISGPLSSSDSPTTFSVSGALEEKEGLIIFNYSIDFRVPVVSTPKPVSGMPPGQNLTIQYQDHSSRGTLKMKPGKSYDLLKSGGNIYSIVVVPEIEK